MVKDIPQQFDESAKMSVDINVIIPRGNENKHLSQLKNQIYQ